MRFPSPLPAALSALATPLAGIFGFRQPTILRGMIIAETQIALMGAFARARIRTLTAVVLDANLVAPLVVRERTVGILTT